MMQLLAQVFIVKVTPNPSATRPMTAITMETVNVVVAGCSKAAVAGDQSKRDMTPFSSN